MATSTHRVLLLVSLKDADYLNSNKEGDRLLYYKSM